MGRAATGHVGVVVRAQVVRGALERMVPDAPAPLRVAVRPAHPGVHAESDGRDERGLAEVAAEAGPEVVVHGVRVHRRRPGVEREPVL